MNNSVSYLRFRMILPLLFVAVLLTFPSMVTGSKYVWENKIDITLKVSYSEQNRTSIAPEGYLSECWIQDLWKIQATPKAEGLVLSAEEGYILPEYIIVKIGQTAFSIKSDGTEAADGITFDPETGLLSIERSFVLQNLDLENPGNIVISAVAVEVHGA